MAQAVRPAKPASAQLNGSAAPPTRPRSQNRGRLVVAAVGVVVLADYGADEEPSRRLGRWS